MRKIAVARFTRTLGTLLSSGVPILDAMEIVAKSAGNWVIEQAVLQARAKIAEGKNMAEPLGETKVFPSMVVQMIGVGEQTGALDTMLNKIADFYEDEVDVAVGLADGHARAHHDGLHRRLGRHDDHRDVPPDLHDRRQRQGRVSTIADRWPDALSTAAPLAIVGRHRLRSSASASSGSRPPACWCAR